MQSASVDVVASEDSLKLAQDVIGDLRKDQPKADRDALVDQALQQRPDLQAFLRDEARAQADIQLQKANAKVDWQFGTEYQNLHFKYNN